LTRSEEPISFRKAMGLANEAGDRKHILLGNGFSIGAHGKFRYGTLYEQAKKSGLSEHVQRLFDRYGTTNFEQVLRSLSEGIWLARLYGLKAADPELDMEVDHELIRNALVDAIASVHPASRKAVEDEKLLACRTFLDNFDSVFTTNYDLLLYWALMVIQPIRFKDGFWNQDADYPNALLFDDVPASPNSGDPFIYFLHGALHLYSEGGQVLKVKWGSTNPPLIDQIKGALEEDRFPLIISEGDPERKKERIEGSGYLARCRRNFQKIEGNLFVFGSSLGEQDTHILQWIAQNQKIRRLFVGVHDNPVKDQNLGMAKRIRDIVALYRRTNPPKLVFYDSDSANVWTLPPH